MSSDFKKRNADLKTTMDVALPFPSFIKIIMHVVQTKIPKKIPPLFVLIIEDKKSKTARPFVGP